MVLMMAKKKFLELCENIFLEKKNADLDDIKNLVERARKKSPRQKRGALNTNKTVPLIRTKRKHDLRLYKVTVAALTLHYFEKTASPHWRKKFYKYLETFETRKLRTDCNPNIRFVKVCIPMRDKRVYNRCAEAVRLAAKKGLSPQAFYKTLKKPGGISKFIEINNKNKTS